MFHCVLKLNTFTGKPTFPPRFHISMNGATIFLDTQILGDSHLLPPLNFSWMFFCSKLPWHVGRKLPYGI